MSSIAEALERRADAQPDRPFVLDDAGLTSWAEAAATAARVASLLAGHGVAPGDRVLLSAGNSALYLHLWFGIRWLGASCVPLHGQATGAAIAAVIADAGIEHAVVDDEQAGRLDGAGLRTHDFASAADLLDRVAGLPEPPPAAVEPGAEATLMYTSGTTGPPKGVILPDSALLAGGRRLADALGLVPDDRMLLCLPLFHANPQVYGLMTALAVGSSVALVPRFRPDELVDQANRLGATAFSYVGTILARVAKTTPRTDHGLRLCVGGGAPRDAWDIVEDRFGIAVHELYGMTETGGWVTANHVGARRRGTCGTARPDVELAVLDEHGRAVPPGTTGEICVRPSAPGVLFSGYHERPALTVERWRDLWFHTGDLGAVDVDGYLSFAGRNDDAIRRGGENISPAAVELALREHPAVAEAAVVGVPHEDLGAEVKAVVVLAAEVQPQDLLTWCAGRLPRFAWPRYLEIRDALPRNATEKLLRNELSGIGAGTIDLRESRPVRTGAREPESGRRR